MKTRIIFYGGAREKNANGSARTIGINDNSAFKFAALNVEKTYQEFGDSVISKKITTAQDIVNFISSLQTSSIASLDILCHGSPLSLNFSQKPYEACGFYASWLGKRPSNLITAMMMATIHSLLNLVQCQILTGTNSQKIPGCSSMVA